MPYQPFFSRRLERLLAKAPEEAGRRIRLATLVEQASEAVHRRERRTGLEAAPPVVAFWGRRRLVCQRRFGRLNICGTARRRRPRAHP